MGFGGRGTHVYRIDATGAAPPVLTEKLDLSFVERTVFVDPDDYSMYVHKTSIGSNGTWAYDPDGTQRWSVDDAVDEIWAHGPWTGGSKRHVSVDGVVLGIGAGPVDEGVPSGSWFVYGQGYAPATGSSVFANAFSDAGAVAYHRWQLVATIAETGGGGSGGSITTIGGGSGSGGSGR